jgi:hypothetical protein
MNDRLCILRRSFIAVDPARFELATFSMPLRRAPNCAMGPCSIVDCRLRTVDLFRCPIFNHKSAIYNPVDLERFELSTSSVRLRRAPNCATGPQLPRGILGRGVFYLRQRRMSRKPVTPSVIARRVSFPTMVQVRGPHRRCRSVGRTGGAGPWAARVFHTSFVQESDPLCLSRPRRLPTLHPWDYEKGIYAYSMQIKTYLGSKVPVLTLRTLAALRRLLKYISLSV